MHCFLIIDEIGLYVFVLVLFVCLSAALASSAQIAFELGPIGKAHKCAPNASLALDEMLKMMNASEDWHVHSYGCSRQCELVRVVQKCSALSLTIINS